MAHHAARLNVHFAFFVYGFKCFVCGMTADVEVDHGDCLFLPQMHSIPFSLLVGLVRPCDISSHNVPRNGGSVPNIAGIPLSQVESEEAINLAKLRALFPDYHSGFEDIIAENAPADSGEQDEAADGAGTGEGAPDARAKALGHMSDKHLSSVVARHCRIFLSLSARRRRSLRGLFASLGGTSPDAAGVAGGRSCSDVERLVAFRDSYRSSVLLAAPTSKLSSSVVLASPTVADAACPVLHMEDVFAGSHLLALADAARLCKTGRSLLEDAAAGGEPTALKNASRKGGRDGVAGVAGWLGEGAVRRNLLLVDPLVNFHLDGNVPETRLADGPLASVLRRVAGLLEDFPGHGVLMQVCCA